ncbi:uncharacterized protein TNIN_369061 [Trichonephila inaurata madagascariensis]|uniref:Uncharacterized protein n=1 Tax=Trichonephila inaurata madagascariensis TaxID=2747483 RepID=A0A8X7C356_9ARAC|nr:uncharacterized protein TNIN_369061 [Trichonephila inaurata madagascariensis]
MAANYGVFIRSTQNNDEIIAACNNLIKDTKSGGRILKVRTDTIYGGLKVYFSEESLIQELLEKQFLYEPGDLSTIHPLISHLTVHNVSFSTTEEKFVENLRKKIRDDLGLVLEVSKIPFSKQYPDIDSGNWRVTLDIPEIEDLDIFKKVGLPDKYSIDIPETLERSSVKFHCVRCDNDGHSQWRCEVKKGDTQADVHRSISQSIKKEDSSEPSPPTKQRFFIRDLQEEQEKDSSSKSKPLLARKKIREFESTIGKEEASRYCNSFSLAETIVKKEAEDSVEGKFPVKRPLSSDEDENDESSAKKPAISFQNKIPVHKGNDHLIDNYSKASSTTKDDSEIEIIHELTPSTSSMNKPNANRSVERTSKHSAEDSVSTSNQPEAIVCEETKSKLPSLDGNDSDSNSATPTRKRRKPTQGIPVVIPERIKGIINNIPGNVLNVVQLEAFLNHVKKKSKPCTFAKIYTPDVEGLKRQLEEISRQYYLIPERGTNEELQFMKWFGNTLQRYDGAPTTTRKRKH